MSNIEKKIVKAIHYKDVEKVFKDIGEYENLTEGKINCIICNEIITIDNFRGILKKNGKLDFFCNKPNCFDLCNIKMKDSDTNV